MRLPTLLIALFLLTFLVYPLLFVLAGAAATTEGDILSLFSHLWSSYDLQVLGNSFSIAAGTTALALAIGVPLAWLTSAYTFPGHALVRGSMLLPMLLPPFVGALGIRKLFSRFGSINLALFEWGLIETPIDWLGSGGPRGIVLIQGLHAFPLVFFTVAATLRHYDLSFEEAAIACGARFRTILWRIRLPLLAPAILGSSLIVAISSLTDLGTPLLFEYRSVIPVRLFDMLADLNENPIAYGLIIELAAICVLLFFVSQRLLSRGRFEAGGRTSRLMTPRSLAFRHYATIVPLLIVLLLLSILPHVAIVLLACGKGWVFSPLPSQFSLESFAAVFHHPLTVRSLIISLALALLAAGLDLVIGLTLGYVEARRSNVFTRTLTTLGNLPLAIPGLVLAFGFVTAFSGSPLEPRVNPLPLLAIAYAVRRLPFMLHLVRAGLATISPTTEEAARTLGASAATTMRCITLPLLFGHLASGYLLCFAFSVLEVSDSLVLALEEKFYPVSKAIYALAGRPDGVPLAAALAVIMTIMIVLCVAAATLLSRRTERHGSNQFLME